MWSKGPATPNWRGRSLGWLRPSDSSRSPKASRRQRRRRRFRPWGASWARASTSASRGTPLASSSSWGGVAYRRRLIDRTRSFGVGGPGQPLTPRLVLLEPGSLPETDSAQQPALVADHPHLGRLH